jgi:molecular chaperone DnaK (HSP70)
MQFILRKKPPIVINTAAIDAALAPLSASFAPVAKRPVSDKLDYSIGLRAKDDVMAFLLRKGASLPASVNESFVTAKDNQRDIHLQFYKGDSYTTTENQKICDFMVRLPPGVKANTEISVVTSVLPDNILCITAKCSGTTTLKSFDLATGQEIVDAPRIVKPRFII